MRTRVTREVAGSALAAVLVAGCVVDGSETAMGSISEEPLFTADECPDGYTPSSYMKLQCPDHWVLQTLNHKGVECVRCVEATETQNVDRQCTGPWRDADLHFGCAPGYHMAYTRGGACKRCVKPAAECVTDDDCFRTGCSGEICSAESVLSACIWLPEYACYDDAHCGCREGRCGWAQDPQLLACLVAH